jgi:hypothetical protein
MEVSHTSERERRFEVDLVDVAVAALAMASLMK